MAINYYNNLDALKSVALKYFVSKLPAKWFFDAPADLGAFNLPADRKARIEIVSHCWNYAIFLHYQLSSLVEHAVSRADVVVTVFYSKEDADTQRVLDFFSGQKIDYLTWNFVALEKEYLFRRSIGRNMAAKSTTADWIWFTDCDSIFNQGCLDSLLASLDGHRGALVYPSTEYRTDALGEGTVSYYNQLPAIIKLVSSGDLTFFPTSISRATGPLQITRGDVARQIGYCDSVSIYQKPALSWCKCVEDRIFRWIIGSSGESVDISNVCRIQHKEKGRYEAGNIKGIRLLVRKLKLSFWGFSKKS